MSINKEIRLKKLLNHWTGKLIVDSEHVFPILFG